jgi:predicted phosphodiesterase
VNGKLSQALTALQGKVTYVNGNHDMEITEHDLHQIPTSSNYQVKYSPDPIYYVQTAGGKKIAFTHGHIFTMFNAPYLDTEISPLPLGYFITRSVAYMLNKTLAPGQTVADLQGQGAPNSTNLGGLVSLVMPLVSSVGAVFSSGELVDAVLGFIMKVTGIPEHEPIILPNGQTTTMAEAKEMYRNLENKWVDDWGGGKDGISAMGKSAIADFDGTYIAWFAQQSALKSGSDLIVLGHTHTPKLGITKGFVNYANNGFECPSSPDIPRQRVTFSVVDTDNCEASIYQVIQENVSYPISFCSVSPDSVISSISMDYSCYVTIDNSNGTSTLNLTQSNAEDGHYVVSPPKQILPGQKIKFWLQDYAGVVGTEGSVTYSVGSKSMTFTYACPFRLAFNKCSGADFYTSTDGVNWGEINKIKRTGYPFFVNFLW